ncbi:MAG TPA: helix-turn-helix domain-containing protein [Thermoanaerobaculia bacterium]|nr:helix-turn-helix domain-containing protein [Thermoanaerobaculia bacterium]
MLTYREYAPDRRLAPLVKCLWTLRGTDDAPRPERILPDGSFELIFHLGDPFEQAGAAQPAAMLMGEIRRAVIIRPSTRADVLGIRFRRGGASGFFQMPMRELCGVVAPLDDVVRGLCGPVFDSPDPMAQAQSMLARRITAPNRVAGRAISLIESRRGDIRIRALAAQIGTTERTLERLFDTHVGVSPKVLARIIRLQATLRGEEAGYHDDAHRLHEFRELAGVSPSAFLREQNAVNAAIVGNLQDAPRTDC